MLRSRVVLAIWRFELLLLDFIPVLVHFLTQIIVVICVATATSEEQLGNTGVLFLLIYYKIYIGNPMHNLQPCYSPL